MNIKIVINKKLSIFDFDTIGPTIPIEIKTIDKFIRPSETSLF